MDTVVTQTGTQAVGGATGSNRGLSALGAEEFLGILITQLQMQDPLQPMDNQELLTQVSQIRDMEMSMNVTAALENLTDQQRYAGVASLIGKLVSGVVHGADGQEQTISGVVTGVRFTERGQAVLELDTGESLPLEKLTTVTTIEGGNDGLTAETAESGSDSDR